MYKNFRACLLDLTMLCLFGLLSSSSAYAAEPVTPKIETRIYELPLLDLPYNGKAFPSMRQSMQLSNDFYFMTHNYLLDKLNGDGVIDANKPARVWPIALFDLVSTYFPLGTGWLHEEWHRAVLGRRGMHSHNGVYTTRFLASSISVDQVRDEDLIALKHDHPDELVRLHSAGFEAEYEQNLELEKQAFFNNHHPVVGVQISLNYLNNIGYMYACASSTSNTETDTMNQQDGANVPVRDFTGFDCTAWTYDLFRPNEAYAARGVHPSGVGINRYRKFSDLTGEEQGYLKKQSRLSLLNLVDPFIFGKKQFTSKSDQWLWNATLRHELTPFGYDIATNVFLHERDGHDIFGAVHLYSNATGTYPGIDVTLPRHPINVLGKAAHVTPRVSAWLQPENLLFRDANAKLGGLASVRLDMPLEYGSGWQAYGELEGKTRGWVAGNEYLTNNLSVRFGLTRVLEVKSRWE
jgi:hypothetical protein